MIEAEHIRELLSDRAPERTLVLLGGRAQVVPTAELDSDRYRGAVELVSGAELARRVGAEPPSDAEVRALASTLEAEAAQLGG